MSVDIDRLAKLLILIGVFSWAPYFILIGFGYAPPVLLFLPIHLSAIIPGFLLKQRKRIINFIKKS
jgi:hypothetical protein